MKVILTVMVSLTEEFNLVLKVSLDGESLQDAGKQISGFWVIVLTAGMAEV